MKLWHTLKNIDLDDALAYSTVKLVRVRDRYLGGLHYAFMIAIFVYVIVFQVFIYQGYLISDMPQGDGVRASLRRPSDGIKDPSELAYCTPTTDVDGGCVQWNRYNLVFPPQRPSSFFVTTRVTVSTHQDLNETVPEKTYYIADIERYTLMFSHGVYGKESGLVEQNRCMSGFLPKPNSDGYIKQWERSNITAICPASAGIALPVIDGSDETKSNDHNVVPGDILTVAQLLEAADMTLDAVSGVDDKARAVRYDGAVLIVFVDYANRISRPTELKYRYVIKRIDKIDVKSEETIHKDVDAGVYEVRNRHGLFLIFVQTGSIGKFSFQALLLTIVSGLVLLKLSTTLVDLLMVQVMPMKKAYYKAKYDLTVDFSDVRDIKKAGGGEVSLEQAVSSAQQQSDSSRM